MLVEALADNVAVVREKARAKLEEPTCGHQSVPALVAGLRDLRLRARVAPLLAFMGRDKAASALVDVIMGDGAPGSSARSAVGAGVRDTRGGGFADVATLITSAAAGRPAEAKLDVIRALTDRLGDARDAADAAVASLLAASPDFRLRYLLVDPIARLAEAGDDPSRARLAELILHDPEHAVRAHAAEHVALARGTADVTMTGLHDADPRVREAMLLAVRSSKALRVPRRLRPPSSRPIRGPSSASPQRRR